MYVPAWTIASARNPKIWVTDIAFFRVASSAIFSAPVAFNKSVTASSLSICPSSHKPTVEWILQSGLREVSKMEPRLPVGKKSEISIDGSSALSMTSSQ